MEQTAEATPCEWALVGFIRFTGANRTMGLIGITCCGATSTSMPLATSPHGMGVRSRDPRSSVRSATNESALGWASWLAASVRRFIVGDRAHEIDPPQVHERYSSDPNRLGSASVDHPKLIASLQGVATLTTWTPT